MHESDRDLTMSLGQSLLTESQLPPSFGHHVYSHDRIPQPTAVFPATPEWVSASAEKPVKLKKLPESKGRSWTGLRCILPLTSLPISSESTANSRWARIPLPCFKAKTFGERSMRHDSISLRHSNFDLTSRHTFVIRVSQKQTCVVHLFFTCSTTPS